jgi:hypothetical protein
LHTLPSQGRLCTARCLGQGSSCPAAPQKTTREIGRMAEAPERYCSNCGQELHPEDRFCSNCGRPVHLTARVPTPEADVPVPPPQQARRSAPPPHPAGAVSTQSNGRPDELSGQAPFSIKEMVVLGVGAGVFTLLTTSQWENFPGKLFFAVLTPMMGTVILSIIKAYLSCGRGSKARNPRNTNGPLAVRCFAQGDEEIDPIDSSPLRWRGVGIVHNQRVHRRRHPSHHQY